MERTEATGFGVALAGHAALFAGLAWLATSAPPPSSLQPIEVSFVEAIGLSAAAPQPVQQPPAQSIAPEVGQPQEAEPAALPEPSRPQPLPLPKAVEPAPAREQARPQPRRDPPVPSQRRTAQAQERPRGSRLGPDLLKGIGRDPSPSRSQTPPAAMTGEARASINAAIRRALVPCERQPLPAPEAAAIRVDVRVTLNPNGSLASAEVARVLNGNPALSLYERRMQDLALAIVRSCTPIRGLPPELYDVPRGWRQFTYQFDPMAR